MMLLLSRTGLRQNENAVAVGAQTERRGLAGPVRDLLGGETSPAAYLTERVTSLSAQLLRREAAAEFVFPLRAIHSSLPFPRLLVPIDAVVLLAKVPGA
jgi:hypothetical protein